MSQYNEHNSAPGQRARELVEVESLVLELLDENLDASGKRRLEALLQQSDAARRRYAELAGYFQPSTPTDERSPRPTTVEVKAPAGIFPVTRIGRGSSYVPVEQENQVEQK